MMTGTGQDKQDAAAISFNYTATVVRVSSSPGHSHIEIIGADGLAVGTAHIGHRHFGDFPEGAKLRVKIEVVG